MKRLQKHSSSFLALLLASALLCACGGAGTSSSVSQPSPPPPPPPPPPAATLSVVGSTLSNVVQGQPMSHTLQATGGAPPYTWKTNGASYDLPPGLSLSADGVLSGIPTAWGNQGVSVQVSDSSSPAQTATGFFTLFVIQQLTIADGAVPSPKNVGLAYSFNLTAFGGYGARVWSLQSGSGPLPPGLTLDTTSGTISGTPTAPGTYNFTVQLTDSGPPQQSVSQAFSLVITNNVVVTNQSLPTGVVNKPFQVALHAAGGTPPYSWSFYGGDFLPTGIQLDPSSGIVSGTPTQSITSGQGFQATDSSSPPQTASQILLLDIQPPLSFTSSTLDDGMVGLVYNFPPLPFTGGISPYTAQVVQGSLPNGVTLPSSPAQALFFSGIPTAPGTFNFTLQITDSEVPPASIQQAFTIRIDPALAIQAPVSLPNGLEGQPYTFSFQASGGHPPFRWILGGSPPSNLTIDPSTGVLSGTPTAPFNDNVVVFVEDSAAPVHSAEAASSLSIEAKLRIDTAILPPIATGSATNIHVTASGGSGLYTWSMVSGSLPSGLIFNPMAATISGRATQSGTYTFALQVSDPGPPAQTSGPLTLVLMVGSNLGRNDSIATATPLSYGTYFASISPISDPPGGVLNPDSDYYALNLSPGTIVNFEITADRLSQPSPLDSVIEVVDATGARVSHCDTLNATLSSFSQPCLNDDIDSTTRDSGLSFEAPPNSGTAPKYYLHVLDFRGDARPDMVYELRIRGLLGTLNILPVTLPPGAIRGVNFQQQLSTTGGMGDITWAVSAGVLPPGLSLSSTGVLGGIPTINGSYDFTISATDHGNPVQTAQRRSTFVVSDPLTITSAALWPNACVNQPYTFAVQTSGGVPPIFWGFDSARWPPINLSQATGVFSGTSTVTGTFTGTVFVSDSAQPFTGQSQNVTLNVTTCP